MGEEPKSSSGGSVVLRKVGLSTNLGYQGRELIIHRMRDLEDREIEEGVEDGIKLPSAEIARTFAVETIDYPNPLGLQ